MGGGRFGEFETFVGRERSFGLEERGEEGRWGEREGEVVEPRSEIARDIFEGEECGDFGVIADGVGRKENDFFERVGVSLGGEEGRGGTFTDGEEVSGRDAFLLEERGEEVGLLFHEDAGGERSAEVARARDGDDPKIARKKIRDGDTLVVAACTPVQNGDGGERGLGVEDLDRTSRGFDEFRARDESFEALGSPAVEKDRGDKKNGEDEDADKK